MNEHPNPRIEAGVVLAEKWIEKDTDEFGKCSTAGGIMRMLIEIIMKEAERMTDQRITAWHQIADHPFFKECYGSQDTLVSAMLLKLDEHTVEWGVRSQPLAEVQPVTTERAAHLWAAEYAEGVVVKRTSASPWEEVPSE